MHCFQSWQLAKMHIVNSGTHMLRPAADTDAAATEQSSQLYPIGVLQRASAAVTMLMCPGGLSILAPLGLAAAWLPWLPAACMSLHQEDIKHYLDVSCMRIMLS